MVFDELAESALGKDHFRGPAVPSSAVLRKSLVADSAVVAEQSSS